MSVGYQGSSIDLFCETLRTHRVRVLIDVRQRAWSHRPQYRKSALSRALADAGISYVHLSAAGNPFRPTKGHPIKIHECAKLYREYLRKRPDIVEDVTEALRMDRSAVFCYEAAHDECHRSVLLELVGKLVPLEITRA